MDETYGKLIEPDPVTFHFGAPGWYVLGVAIVVLLVLVAWLIGVQYKQNAYRRTALREMRELLQRGEYLWSTLYQANMRMKQIAITQYGRIETAELEKEQWINFLNKSAKKKIFDQDDGELLQTALYAPAPNSNVAGAIQDFLMKAGDWIHSHKRSTKIS